jgi:predicted GH43/DUF377 family glycosyl hydrolase
MVEVKKEGIILTKTHKSFENQAVLNPAVINEGNSIHLFYRAVRKGNHSSIGYCKLNTHMNVIERLDEPLLSPEFEYESHGMEDPRIVKIDDLYYLTYTAFNGVNALGALATSKDLKHFEKKGLIVPKIKYNTFKRLVAKCNLDDKYYKMNEAQDFLMVKDVVFFPRRIKGNLHFMIRIRPDIQIVSVKKLEDLTDEFWEDYFIHFDKNIMLTPKHEHEMTYIGAGCPPIETKYGWLLIYHGVTNTNEGYFYCACVTLLDIDNPQKELARLPHRLLIPEQEWELKGEVNKVVFPTGTILIDDTLYIYYGAADERIACASLSLTALLAEVLIHPL